MLFAAGFGTRMGALTKDRPKPLVEVAGKALLDHALDISRPLGLNTVVNTHYKSEMITDHLAGQDISISDESGAILETGGGLKKALPLLGPEPVFTMNTDAVWRGPNALDCLANAWRPDVMDALLLCVPIESAIGNAGDRQLAMDADGRLTRGPGFVYTGAQIIKTDLLDEIEQDVFSLRVLWDKISEKGAFFGEIYPGSWCDVGTPEGVKLAEDMLVADV